MYDATHYDWVSRRLLAGADSESILTAARRRWGDEAWIEVRMALRDAIASLAAGSAMTIGQPDVPIPDSIIPVLPWQTVAYRYYVEVTHNPGEKIRVVIERGAPLTFARSIEIAKAALKAYRAARDTVPLHVGDMIIYPPSDWGVPKGVFDVRIIQVTRGPNTGGKP